MSDVSLRYLLFGEDRSASKSMHGVGEAADGLASKVGGAFGKLGSVVGGEVGEILSKVGEGIDHLGEHTKGLAPKLAIGAGALTGIGAALQMVGSHEKQARDQLEQAFKNVGADAKDYGEEIERTIKRQENYAHSAVETQQALQVIVQATRDPKQALHDMAVVADLAATKHISLVEAAQKVAGVYNGQTKILKSFGITMDSQKEAVAALTSADRRHEAAVTSLSKAQQKLSDIEAIDATRKKLTVSQQIQLRNARDAVSKATALLKKTTDDLTAAEERNKNATHAAKDAVTQLGDATKGQAKKSVDNFGGTVDIVKVKIEDWAGKVAQFAGGPLTYLGTALGVVTGVMQVYSGWQARAAATQEAETAATVSQTLAQRAAGVAAAGWTAAQWLLNAALSANPIGLVVIALVALVAIFVVAWKHSETFRNIVRGALHAVLEVFQAVWGWIKDNWPLLLGILAGPFALAVGEIVKHWNDVEEFFKAAPGRIGGFFTSIGEHIKTAFREAINFVIGIWNHFVGYLKIPGFDSHIPGVPKFHGINIGKDLRIPLLAGGGIVRSPTLAMIGEHGAEAVIPLSRAGDAGGIGGTTYNITITGALDPSAVGRQVDKILRQLHRETGGALGIA